MQYITSQLAQNRTPENDDLIAELAEKFRGRRLTDLATELQRRFELNAVAENEFGNLVKTMSTQGTERRRAPTVDISGLVLEIYEQRELKVDLMPTLLEIVREASQQRNWNQVSNTQAVFLQYLRKQASVHGPSVVVTALAGLAEAIVGDQEQQAALIEKYGNKSSLPPNRGEGAPYATYLGYLASMIRIPELVFPALAEAQRYRAGEHVDIKMAGYRVAEYFSSERSADKVIALLDGSPFLNRLEEFQPLQIENENISTVLGNLLDRLRYGEWSSRGAIAKKLKAREQNFGTRLFVAVMEADRWEGLSVKDVHEALKPDLEVLASLPEERLIAISILVEEVSKNYRRRAYTSTAGDPEVEAVLAKASGAAPAFDKLMAATSLSSLGVESYSYGIQEYAIQVLAPLLKDRPQDFVAGLNHLMKLSRSVLRRQNENATVLIRRILRESVSQSPIEGVAATILVASEPGGEPLDLLSMYGSDLLTAFTSLFIQTKDDRDAGAPSHSLVSVSTRLAELLGDADTSSLHNLLLQYVVDNQFSELKLKDVATWAIEAREGSAYPAIAQQWWIASQMALLAKEVDSNERVDLVALRSSLLSQVQNETLSLASRHVSAVSLLSPKIAAEVGEIKTCMDVITEFVGKSGDEPSVTDWMFSIIVRLEGLEDGEQLKEVGGKFAATWERHATSAYKSGRGMTAALPSIRLYHRLDRPTGVQAVVRGLGENASRPEVVAELTRLGYANLAWSQLNRNWPQIDVRNLQIIDVANTTGPVSLGEIQVAFDPELEARLPELVALANHPGTKFLTQLYVSLLPDSADEALKPSVSRDERIAQLAAQYSDQTFVSADEQKLVVLLLAKAKELPAPIVTDIHTMADKLLPFDLWNRRSDNQVVERNRDLIALQIALHLRDGNQESLDKLMTQMETTDPDDYEKRNAVSRMVSVLADQLTKTIEAVDPEIIVAATPNLLKLESGNQYSRSGQLRGLLQIWFLVNDRGKEFADLVNQSSAGSGARPGASRSPAQDTNIDSLWPIAIRLKPGILEAEVEERAKFVKTIWELCKSGASVGSGHFQQGVKESCAGCRVAKMGLDAIEDAKLLTAAELIDYGPELARIDAVGGEIYRQIGHKLMAAEQWEEAASSLQRAISAGSRTMTAAKSNRQVEYAWALHKLDRKDEAKKVLGELESFELYGENPQRLSILKTELE